MNKIWAPWRAPYITSAPGVKRGGRVCIFCAARAHRSCDGVLFETPHAVAMLNKYPYNNGHLMVAPRRHVRDLSALSDADLLGLWKAVERARKLLVRALKPQGFNIGMNIGASGGAGIPGHAHIHIVPRWRGDTNFMPVLAATKVISQSLEELYRQLTHADRPD